MPRGPGRPPQSLRQSLPRAGVQTPRRPTGPPPLLRGPGGRQSPACRRGPGRPLAPLGRSLLWATPQRAGALPWLHVRLLQRPPAHQTRPLPGWKGPFWHRSHGLTPFPLPFARQGLWPLFPGSHAHLASHWDGARVFPLLPLTASSRQALAKSRAHRSLGLTGLSRALVSHTHPRHRGPPARGPRCSDPCPSTCYCQALRCQREASLAGPQHP